ncbi:hypothetical protein AB0877_17350 [Micromonospora sp. NPDC047644]|uniref:hypothetical protein n=1 Tax=Micromonospora sp. NPDC047644 TaxID=3157203 RepID=UPI003451CDB6
MNWRQFIAALLQTVAWPLTVLIVVLLFRKKINGLLGDRLRRLTAGPVEAEWAESIGLAQEAVESDRPRQGDQLPNPTTPEPEPEVDAEAVQPTQSEPSPSSTERPSEHEEPRPQPEPNEGSPHQWPTTNPIPVPDPRPSSDPTGTVNDSALQVNLPAWVKVEPYGPPGYEPPRSVQLALVQAEAARRVAKTDPTSATMMGFKALDAALSYVAESSGLPQNIRDSTPRQVAKHLADKGLIGNGTYRAIAELSKLRNAVAHTSKKITPGDALLYLNTLGDVLRTLLYPSELYESQVAAALVGMGFEVNRTGGGTNFLVVTAQAAIAVEVKYLPGRTLSWNVIDKLVGKAAVDRTSLLFVTNALLDKSIQERDPSVRTRLGCRIEVVSWLGPEDDGHLWQAVLRAGSS